MAYKLVKICCRICTVDFISTARAMFCPSCRPKSIVIRSTKWRKANSERYRLAKQKSREKHKEKNHVSAKIWREKNTYSIK